MILYNNKYHGEAIAEAAGFGYRFNPVHHSIISRVNNSYKLLGGVIFTEFTGTSVQMHVASFVPGWSNKDLLWNVFHYPFVQLGVRRIFGFVKSTNLKTLRFDIKLGFEQIAVLPDYYPDADRIVFSMTKEQCKWLNLKPKSIEDKKSG